MQTEIALGFEGAWPWPADRPGAWVPEAISLMKRNNCGKALAIAARPATSTAATASAATIT